MSGVLSDAGLSVQDAIVATWADGGALDSFRVLPTKQTPPDADALTAAIVEAFDRPLEAPPTPDAEVVFDDDASPWYTLCEVRCVDRPGLAPYDHGGVCQRRRRRALGRACVRSKARRPTASRSPTGTAASSVSRQRRRDRSRYGRGAYRPSGSPAAPPLSRPPELRRSTRDATCGVDTGGTFTDLVDDDGRVVKVPSTPDDPTRRCGLRSRRSARARPPSCSPTARRWRPTRCSSGGVARVALVTTQGFADVIEIARQDRPSLYDPYRRPAPRRSCDRDCASRSAAGSTATVARSSARPRDASPAVPDGVRRGRGVPAARRPRRCARAGRRRGARARGAAT